MKAKEHFSWQAWPKSGLRKEFVLKGSGLDKEFIGAVLRQDIKSGLPLTAQLLYRGGEKGFVASGLKPGMRAVAVKIDPTIGVGGFARAGDRVDIILTSTMTIGEKEIQRQVRNSSISRKVSETIIRNIRVIAINQNAESGGKNEKKPKVATLEVTEKQAEILANARRMGKLLLVLRSHVPGPDKPQPRKYQFTTDLEIMSALRGGLAAHIYDINQSATAEFRLDRWLGDSANGNTAKAATRSSGGKQPKVVRRLPARPTVTPSTTAKRKISTTRTKAPSAAQIKMEKKLQELENKLSVQEDEMRKAAEKPATVAKSEKKPVAAKPASKVTVRVDRAGAIQTLKFKEAQ